MKTNQQTNWNYTGYTKFKMDGILINNRSENPNPEYATEGSAGFDIRASQDITIPPGETVVIGTGLYFAVPRGFEAQIRMRSSLATQGLTIPNAPGTIDSDYRGEVKVVMYNLGRRGYMVEHGDRIAQVVVAAVVKTTPYFLSQKEYLDASLITIRGDKGFGSTGRN